MKPFYYLFLAVVFAVPGFGDHVNSSVSLGGYFLKSADAKTGRDFYQYEALSVSLLKNGLGFNGSFRYSDFYNARPNSYSLYSRLSLASLSYTSSSQAWFGEAGRIFLPLLNHALIYDGAHFRYQKPGWFQAGLLAGFSGPSPYQANLAELSPEHRILGARFSFTGLKDTRIIVDAVTGATPSRPGTDTGTANRTGALGIYRKLGQNLRLEADGLVRYKNYASVDAGLRARYYFNQLDAMWVQAYRRDRKTDTTDYYDSLVNPLRYGAGYGFSYTLSPDANLNLDYALLIIDGSLDHVFSVAAGLWDGFLGYEQQAGSLPSQEIKAGYAYAPFPPLRLSLDGGYLRYKLMNRPDYYRAARGVAALTYSPFPFLQATVEAQYLANRFYDHDVRVYAGLRYQYRKPLE